MFIISIISFSIQDNLGDPLREMLGQSVSETDRELMRDEMGLNDPFFTVRGGLDFALLPGIHADISVDTIVTKHIAQ